MNKPTSHYGLFPLLSTYFMSRFSGFADKMAFDVFLEKHMLGRCWRL